MVRTTGLKSEYIPIKHIGNDVYMVNWDYTPVVEKVSIKNESTGELEFTGEIKGTNLASWITTLVYHVPTLQEIKTMILDWYDNQTDDEILQGFKWNGNLVWLSTENQFNYKVAYDLAVQTSGNSLPITFKFGTRENPIYQEFTTLEELTSFYTAAMNHINSALKNGWDKKDSIDWSVYESFLINN